MLFSFEKTIEEIGKLQNVKLGVECDVHFYPGEPAKLWGPPEDCYESSDPEWECEGATVTSYASDEVAMNRPKGANPGPLWRFLDRLVSKMIEDDPLFLDDDVEREVSRRLSY